MPFGTLTDFVGVFDESAPVLPSTRYTASGDSCSAIDEAS
jgi:hypothetical protein